MRRLQTEVEQPLLPLGAEIVIGVVVLALLVGLVALLVRLARRR